MYIQYQNDQFFLPFSVNCSQVGMFQIYNASLVSVQAGGGGWSTKCGQASTRGGGGSKKFPDLYGHPLWMTPKREEMLLIGLC